MSIDIVIKDAVKKYNRTTVVDGLSLTIQGGEFFTLLGPSGCGKTTLLRMIAGFNSIEGGDFYFGGKRINDLDPAKRNIGMVFQNYAIFPHLTVRQNVEFGLKARKFSSAEIKKEADEFLELMQIAEFADRLPERLSGGQQQRVALARALVIRPDVLLMDEPLSNLDAKLRIDMRTVIKEIQNKLKITTVYVTHDQEEAMAISDRIAVMKSGSIQQIGNPKQLYQRPENTFVSSFIGRTNLLEAEMMVDGDSAFLQWGDFFRLGLRTLPPRNRQSQKVLVSIRPEDFTVALDGSTDGLPGTIEDSIFLGLNTHYFIKLATGERIVTIQESTIDNIIEKGSPIILRVKMEKINVFDKTGARNLLLEPKEGLV
ncbi:Vitamin B12 import ATP-binding protein BtuD [bioreactor metagenome]|uniref:Vitamin B12 import ATP-binding protein BtuD n=1 Tax=bioreactor metagenome TaxID=1076179 RepID=A0A645BIV4_9ZZZZ|nr:ABC transporter ATP-binding protein [Bacilli bacterium]